MTKKYKGNDRQYDLTVEGTCRSREEGE